MKKISVIIPVYNTEKELSKCLYSVQNQSYSNLEIICVDDGSDDGSDKIIDKFGKKDSRFKVLHQQNAGESNARNKGLQMATGDVIAFCDCDDSIEYNMYEEMIDEMNKYDLDMIAAGWCKETYEDTEIIRNLLPVAENVFGRDQLLKYIYMRDSYRGFAYMWNKLYKRDILKDLDGKPLFFEESLSLGGDVVYLGKAALNVARAKYIASPFYHYNQRINSGCHTEDVVKLRDWLRAYEMIIEVFTDKKIDTETINYAKRFLAYHSSNAAEIAIAKNLEKPKKVFQNFMKAYEREYIELNCCHPERIERYYRLLDA